MVSNLYSLDGIVKPLLAWYRQNARVLPWREDPRPYRVWLSEIMLQQTRVETVKPYFERFLDSLPTIASLAAAPEEQILKLWQGLGYYSRVRTMQKAARILVEQYGGELPASYEELKKLPGFGEYTAGAVASIAFGLPAPAVDGNVLRVISRIEASFDDIARPETKARITAELAAVEPPGRAGDFNQSLMELGATVCLPNGAPKCLACPLRELCRGYADGIAEELPKKAAKAARKREDRTVFVLISQNRVGLQKRPPAGLLASMWEFPNQEGKLGREEALALLAEWGMRPFALSPLKKSKHIFSHIEWHMTGWMACLDSPLENGFLTWASAPELSEQYSVPTAFRAYYQEASAALEQDAAALPGGLL